MDDAGSCIMKRFESQFFVWSSFKDIFASAEQRQFATYGLVLATTIRKINDETVMSGNDVAKMKKLSVMLLNGMFFSISQV